MTPRTRGLTCALALGAVVQAQLRAQEAAPPSPPAPRPAAEDAAHTDSAAERHAISNADVLDMVHNQFDEATLLSVIELNDTQFDVSPQALIALRKGGVTDRVIAAMLETKRRPPLQGPAATASPPAPGVAPGAPDPQAANLQAAMARAQAGMARLQAMGYGGALPSLHGMPGASGGSTSAALPRVLLGAPANVELSPSYAQRALSKLSSSEGAGQGASMLRSLAMEALKFASIAGGPSGMAAGMAARSGASMFGHFMPGSRPGTPSITYAWGLPGRHSERVLPLGTSSFSLHYDDIPGTDPDSIEPAVIRLAVTRDNYRLLGATRQKMGREMTMGGTGEWIAEERVTVQAIKEGRGVYTVKLEPPLASGEYALVLRPVKGYKPQASAFDSTGQLTGTAWDFSWP
jgi:hypothetical protein